MNEDLIDYSKNSLFRKFHNHLDIQLSVIQICDQLSCLKYVPERIDLLKSQAIFHINDPQLKILFKVVKTNSEKEFLSKMLLENNVQQ